jgi:8-oxo-dGTP pyrophosphatase MutT (NUDIX family)
MAVEPIPAASLILLRDHPLEVLMIRRRADASFAPDFWAFPGGAKDDDDDSMRATALRETLEEIGVQVESELVWTSRWITPAGLPKRFDTYFFLAKVPRDTQVTPGADEVAECRWIAPREALTTLKLMFPTIKNLEAVLGFDSADALIDSRRDVDIPTIEPVLVNGKPTLR